MRILIDAMGGDNAPGEIVRGAVDAAAEFDVDVCLVGQEEKILAALKGCGVDAPGGHPSDLGMIQLADAYQKAIAAALKELAAWDKPPPL